MGFSPRNVGNRRLIHCKFYTDSGNFSLSGLSSGDLAMHFMDVKGQVIVGTGVWGNISVDGSGVWSADYTPSVADVATAATYDMYPVAQVDGSPVAFDPQDMAISNLR